MVFHCLINLQNYIKNYIHIFGGLRNRIEYIKYSKIKKLRLLETINKYISKLYICVCVNLN